MSALLASFSRLLEDPPPEFVFEFAPDAIRMARPDAPDTIRSEPVPHGVISPSPLHDNIALIEPLNEAVLRLLPPSKSSKRRTAALLLPDHCAHVAVLDFDNFPDKPEEQAALIRFRLKRSVPFDVETAALSYWIQEHVSAKGPQTVAKAAADRNRREALVAITPIEIVRRYEAPLRSAGLHPGLVSLAPLACLDLIDAPGLVAMARLNGPILTVLVAQSGVLKVIRFLELEDRTLQEIGAHIHQTFVYAEDSLGALPSELLLAGFGDMEQEAMSEFPAEFQVPVNRLGGADTAIRGYLRGYLKSPSKGAAA